MIDPEVTAWCPRGDMRTAAYFVASAAQTASRSARRLLRFRLVTTRLLGRAPRGGIRAGARVVTMRTIINRFDSGTPASCLVFHMLLRTRRTPSGFVEPCLPSPAERPPMHRE